MALELQDKKMLDYPFPAKAHKFIGENAYLHEEPITDRLDMVDLNWSWVIIKIDHRANAGEGGKDVGTVTVHGRLTVKGVSRDGIGMAVIQRTNEMKEKKWDDVQRKQVETGNVYTSEANEAEKSATTDAFKRAARMFGMGRYLLTLPKQNGKATVTDIAGLEKWLKTTYGDIQAMPTYYDEAAQEETESPAPNVLEPDFHLGAKPDNWLETLSELTKPLYDNKPHQDNSIAKLISENVIKRDMHPDTAAAYVFMHCAGNKDLGFNAEDVKAALGMTLNEFLKRYPRQFAKAWKLLFEHRASLDKYEAMPQ